MLSLALAAGVAMKVVSERLGTHRSRSRPTFTPTSPGAGKGCDRPHRRGP